MATQLTQADVARLLAEPSPLVRAEVATKLAHDIDDPKLTGPELKLALDIIRVLARDVEAEVRQALSISLRRSSLLPHDVAVKLANDVESVALPILENSHVLTDDDLTALIKSSPPSKQEAIGRRDNISETVSDTLISSAGESAVAILMKNSSAKINDLSLAKAVDRFPQSPAVQESMVKRERLPVTVAERLAVLVSEQLQDYLVAHHELPQNIAANIVMRGRERATISMASGDVERNVEKLVEQMYKNKRLTPSIIIRALCMGDVAFFEAAMAILANVPIINVRILLHDGGEYALRSVYGKAEMPAALFPIVRAAIKVIHETLLDGEERDLERYRARIIERVLTQFEDISPSEDIEFLLEKLANVA